MSGTGYDSELFAAREAVFSGFISILNLLIANSSKSSVELAICELENFSSPVPNFSSPVKIAPTGKAPLLTTAQLDALIAFVAEQELLLQQEEESGGFPDNHQAYIRGPQDIYSRLVFLICYFIRDQFFASLTANDFRLLQQFLERVEKLSLSLRMQKANWPVVAGMQQQVVTLLTELKTRFVIAEIYEAYNSKDERLLKQLYIDPRLAGAGNSNLNMRYLAYLARLALNPEQLKAAIFPTGDVTEAERVFQAKQNLLAVFFLYNAARMHFIDAGADVKQILEDFLKKLMAQVSPELLPEPSTAATIFKDREVPEAYDAFLVHNESINDLDHITLDVLAREYMFYLAMQVMTEDFFAIPPTRRKSTYVPPSQEPGDLITSVFAGLRKRSVSTFKPESFAAPPFKDKMPSGWSAAELLKMIETMLRFDQKQDLDKLIENPVMISMLITLYGQYLEKAANINEKLLAKSYIDGFLERLFLNEYRKYPREPNAAQQHSIEVMLYVHKFMANISREYPELYPDIIDAEGYALPSRYEDYILAHIESKLVDQKTQRELAAAGADAYTNELFNKLGEAFRVESRVSRTKTPPPEETVPTRFSRS